METNESMTVNHHRHMPYLLQAQVRYKRGILNYEDARILRTIIRIGLPSISIPRSERISRDEGIIKLLLYFLRNVAVIAPSPYLPMEGDENEVSRSATIEAFHQQEVFALLLTMASNMGEEFIFQDVPVMEILFHLLKGVSVEKLFMNDKQRKSARSSELNDILKKESSMNREYAKTAPTRHGRFGTMIWVKRADEKVSTVSGQDILMDGRKTMQRMDETKKWNRPMQRNKNDKMSLETFDTQVVLTSSATRHLRVFVEEFLDSGFNPLFTHVRKAIEREAERVGIDNYRQFFFLVSWFLEAERVRRKAQMETEKRKNPEQAMEPDIYALVASVLNQETFITLNRYMQNSYDNKEWQDLNASMRCFTQILLTVQEMAASPLEEDQEISENIQNRIFYEETTHDRIVSILRGYKDQGFGYLDACTELSHVFLRMLERYSKENVDLQVRSRRKARRKKTQEQPAPTANDDEDNASEAEELAEAARVSRERKFDFKRFSARFATQKCVDTFVAFTTFYKDLDLEQLKRAHRFFYRVAFKQELPVILYRLDIISLFYKMIKGPEGLDSSKPIFKEWDELVRQLLKRLMRKIDKRPQLIVELLFSKIPGTVHFLEYGEEKQTISSSKAPAELEVNPNGASTRRKKIEIVVAALFVEGKIALAQWVAKELKEAADERISWEAEAEARKGEGNGEDHNMRGVSDLAKHPSSGEAL
jgi:replication fork protection complex subunit Tof1/Swi1